jgi:hypothetical protein
MYESTANTIAFTTAGTMWWNINPSGALIGTNSPNTGTGQPVLDGSGLYMTTWLTTASAANAHVSNSNYIKLSTSSIRYKHDIDTLDADHALSAVMAMRPVTYRGKTDDDQRRHVGFIAEEVAEIAPLLATYDEGGETGTPNYVTYDRVTAYLVAVVQQQQAEINALKAQMKEKQ